MNIIKQVLDFLESLEGDNKEAATALVVGVKEHSTKFNNLEKTERETAALKEQLGDNKLSDLLSNHQFITDNGGIDGVTAWKGDDEASKAEIALLKADHVKVQEAHHAKTKALTDQIAVMDLHDKVRPFLGKFPAESHDYILSQSEFAMVGDTLVLGGQPFAGAGEEKLAETFKYLIQAPTSGGAETPVGGTPTQPEKQLYGVTEYPE